LERIIGGSLAVINSNRITSLESRPPYNNLSGMAIASPPPQVPTIQASHPTNLGTTCPGVTLWNQSSSTPPIDNRSGFTIAPLPQQVPTIQALQPQIRVLFHVTIGVSRP
jgi:hypothetical protein